MRHTTDDIDHGAEVEEGLNENAPDDASDTNAGQGTNTQGGSPITSPTTDKTSSKTAASTDEAVVKEEGPVESEDNNLLENNNKQPVLLGSQPRGLYECDYCHADLTRSPRARCAICPDFDLCLDCLATSDHVEMCKSRREFQRMHRAKTELTKETGRPKKKGRRKKVEEEEEDDPNILGYYHNGQWIPFFRHKASHGYVVADSTRYMLFPPFRGVGRDLVGMGSGETYKRVGDGVVKGGGSQADGVEAMNVENSDMELDELKKIDSNDTGGQKTDETVEASKNINVDEHTNENVPAEPKTEANTVSTEPKTNDYADTEMKEPHIVSSIDVTSIDRSEETISGSVAQNNDDISTKQSSNEPQLNKPKLRLLDDIRNPWTIEEDLRLLDGILACGLGNWPDIAEHVNGSNGEAGSSTAVGGKSDKMCMERYLDDFLGRYGQILPPYTMVPTDGEEEKKSDSLDVECVSVGSPTSERTRPRRTFPIRDEDTAPGFKKTKFCVVATDEFEENDTVWPLPYIPPIADVKFGDEVARDLWYRSEQSFVRQCSSAASKLDVEMIRQDFIEKRAQNVEGYEAKVLPPRVEDLKSYPGSELAGYMPRREDFDVEHDNDAEHLIADMEFSAEDSKSNQDLKVEVIKIFNSKLDEREKRKKFVLEKKLINYRENQEEFQKLPADERHLIHRMRLFERFHSMDEHKTFMDNILKAKRLRKEIAKLQTYRRLGITSLADAEKYELDKSRREYHKMAWLKKEAETKKAEADAARQAKENASDLSISALDDGIGPAANQSLRMWKQYNHDSPNKRMRISEGADSTSVSVAATGEVNQTVESTGPGKDENQASEALPRPNDFILDNKPGFEMLSSNEKELCKKLQLLPQNYLRVKRALISESLAAGISDSKKGKTFVTIDVNQCDDVIDFILKAGWISGRPVIEQSVNEESQT